MSRFANDPQKTRLAELWGASLEAEDGTKSQQGDLLRALTRHHEAAPLFGHVLLDMLEEAGFAPDEISALGGCTPATEMIGLCVLFAATSRGLDIDAFQVSGAQLLGPKGRAASAILVVDGAEKLEILESVATLSSRGRQVLALVQLWEQTGHNPAAVAAQALELPLLTLFSETDLAAQ